MKPCLQRMVDDYNESNTGKELGLEDAAASATATFPSNHPQSEKEEANSTDVPATTITTTSAIEETTPEQGEESRWAEGTSSALETADVDAHESKDTNGIEEDEPPPPPWRILPLIVLSQFGGTSVWFAGNAILPDLAEELDLPEGSLGLITSSTQFGFIVGTLIFAVLGVADRFLPTRVFMVCAILAAFVNLLILTANGLGSLLTYRSLTGVFLAGIYPVGMKVAADWFESGLGNALGFLVGALVLGTGFPFLLSSINQPWQALQIETAILATLSGLIMGFFVSDGPHRKQGSQFKLDGLWVLFKDNNEFRSAAFGYFGHMWELYAFWAFVPVVWNDLILNDAKVNWNPDAISFVIISVGFLGCAVGGIISKTRGSAWVARVTLAISGASCIISPLAFLVPIWLALVFYIIWGITVVADSPQFSSLVAQSTPPERKGSALTIVNCLGFAITIGSIQLLSAMNQRMDSKYLFLFLIPGPIFGMWYMKTDFRRASSSTQQRHQTIERR